MAAWLLRDLILNLVRTPMAIAAQDDGTLNSLYVDATNVRTPTQVWLHIGLLDSGNVNVTFDEADTSGGTGTAVVAAGNIRSSSTLGLGPHVTDNSHLIFEFDRSKQFVRANVIVAGTGGGAAPLFAALLVGWKER